MKCNLKRTVFDMVNRFRYSVRVMISRAGMVFGLVLLAQLSLAKIAWADPNDYNPCGQYNDYMGNLCQYDKETEKVYPDGNPPSCSDCNKPDVALNAKTKFEPSSAGSGKSGVGGSGAAEGTD